jgi:uncharacterized protein YjbI with pentapeptide repeats
LSENETRDFSGRTIRDQEESVHQEFRILPEGGGVIASLSENFGNSNFNNATIYNSNIHRWHLEYCSLDGLRSARLSGYPFLPTDWHLVGQRGDGKLLGPTANLSPLKIDGKLINCVIKNEILSDKRFDAMNMQLSELNEVDFRNSSLRSVTFKDALLVGVDFSGCDLSNSDFSGTNLSNVVFDNANLENANFQGARLSEVRFVSANLAGTDFTNTNLRKVDLDFANIAQSKMKFSNFNAVSGISVKGKPSNVPDGTLIFKDTFVGPGSTIRDLDFENFDLTRANLSGVSSSGITGNPKLPERWQLVSGTLIGPNANLNKVHFSNQTLVGLDLEGIDLRNTVFFNCSVKAIQGTPSHLDPNYAIHGGQLFGPGMNIEGYSLEGLPLAEVNLHNICSGDIIGKPKNLPNGWKIVNGYLVGPHARLIDANLQNTRIEGVDLQGANLDGALLNGDSSSAISGKPSRLPNGWKISGGLLIGPEADVSNANLRDSDLSGIKVATLRGEPSEVPDGYSIINSLILGPRVDLTGANLDNLDLSNVDLHGISSERVTGNPKLPTGWALINGYLVGPAANLANANLSNSDLSEIDLSGCNLENANFEKSIFSKHIDNLEALPPNAKLIKGYLLGPGLILKNGDLSGTDFSGLNLDNADLSSCIINGSRGVGIVGEPKLPKHWELRSGVLFGPKADLSRLELVQVNIDGLNLQYANLDFIQTKGLVGKPSKLPSGWVVEHGHFFGPTSDLRNVHFNDSIELKNVSLSQALLPKVSGISVNFIKVKLPENCFVQNGSLYSSLELLGEDLSDWDLVGVDLSEWKFEQIRSSRIKGNPKLPIGWKLVNGYLVGRTAFLMNANFSHADLSNLDLTDVNFRGANLEGVDFRNCDLTNADFSFANLRGASFDDLESSGAIIQDAVFN